MICYASSALFVYNILKLLTYQRSSRFKFFWPTLYNGIVLALRCVVYDGVDSAVERSLVNTILISVSVRDFFIASRIKAVNRRVQGQRLRSTWVH